VQNDRPSILPARQGGNRLIQIAVRSP
jgi:hypothetical protein